MSPDPRETERFFEDGRYATFFEWTVPLAATTKARYVRLVRESKDIFHLSEVEVY